MEGILSKPPKVLLTKVFNTPFDNAVATARTCYTSRIITDEDVRKDERSINLRDQIAKSTYVAGHHTTLQHAHFQFSFENVSRHALWSFFHAHPFYNSEQVSQRYVRAKTDRFLVPKFKNKGSLERYEAAIKRQMDCYEDLLSKLHPAAESAYFSIYKGRAKQKDDKRWQNAIKKRCQEVARYVLPISTHAHLYHTVSGLTLHRYHRIAHSQDCPFEQKAIAQAMVAAVSEVDPLFFRDAESTLSIEQSHEAKLMAELCDSSLNYNPKAQSLVDQFDAQLDGKTAKLVSATPQSVQIIGESVRQAMSLDKETLSDEAALEWVMNPAKNTNLGESLNLSTLSKPMRALEMVHFTFQKKVSHCADSQLQRHRMTPGVRPLLWRHVNPQKPDFITPKLFENPLAHEAKELFDNEMQSVFKDIAYLVSQGESPESWQYLLPNSFPVRFTDSGSLLNHHHKWTMRLCYNAQEEIFHSSLDEVNQVHAQFPEIGKWLLPPCGQRALSKSAPVCPEGIRFCGVPVWRLERKNYLRVL